MYRDGIIGMFRNNGDPHFGMCRLVGRFIKGPFDIWDDFLSHLYSALQRFVAASFKHCSHGLVYLINAKQNVSSKKFTYKGTLQQVFISLRPSLPVTPYCKNSDQNNAKVLDPLRCLDF